MNRRNEILSVNKRWGIDVLIKLLAFIHEIEDYDSLFFEELEILKENYLEAKEDEVQRKRNEQKERGI